MEVTINSYLLATGTAASPAEALSTSHPCCLPCPYPPALTPIVSWIYPHRLNVVAENGLDNWPWTLLLYVMEVLCKFSHGCEVYSRFD